MHLNDSKVPMQRLHLDEKDQIGHLDSKVVQLLDILMIFNQRLGSFSK